MECVKLQEDPSNTRLWSNASEEQEYEGNDDCFEMHQAEQYR